MDFLNIIISQNMALLFIGLSSVFSILLGFFVFNAPTANIFIWILRLLIISALWFGFSFYVVNC